MKPHIVLIPGAWHSADAYETLLPFLHHTGYETTALTLPSVGAEPPITSLDPETKYIQAKILHILDANQDVVVVMHSYGGFAGSAALRGLAKWEREQSGGHVGVIALVYLTAWMIDEGETVRGAGGGRGASSGPPRVREDGDYVYHIDPIPNLYHDIDPDLAAEYATRLKHHSLPTMFMPQIYAAHKMIPTTYLLCKNDRTIAYERQLKLVEDSKVPITTFTCDAGHSPFLSQPELTSKVIRHAAGEDIEVE